MSGGEQQRVAIARALVNDPFVLIADEPTGNLDERATRGVFQLLRDINASGTAVMMATHNLELVRRVGLPHDRDQPRTDRVRFRRRATREEAGGPRMRLALRETMIGFRRAPMLSVLSITTIAFSLFAFGLFSLVALNIRKTLERRRVSGSRSARSSRTARRSKTCRPPWATSARSPR